MVNANALEQKRAERLRQLRVAAHPTELVQQVAREALGAGLKRGDVVRVIGRSGPRRRSSVGQLHSGTMPAKPDPITTRFHAIVRAALNTPPEKPQKKAEPARKPKK